MTRHTARRLLATAVLALVAAPGLAACSVTNEVTSMHSYEPGDGVSAHVKGVKVRNMVVVAERAKGPGVLSATAFNEGTEDTKLALQVGQDEPFVVTVPAGQMVVIGQGGPTGGRTTVPGQLTRVDVAPGGLVDVRVGGAEGGATVRVPVHTPDGIYSTFTPAEEGSTAGITSAPPAATKDAPRETATVTSTSTTTSTAVVTTAATATR